MDNLNETTKTWGIVELMGHKVVAGLVSKSEMIGAPLVRVDVPATSAFGEFTQFYGTSAIYCVTFVSEEVARLTAEQTKVNPVSVYVPELITREKLDEVIGQYSKQIERMREMKGLPAGRTSCTWTASSDEDSRVWSTSCGQVWQFEDGDPADNDVDYCMFCGQSVSIFNEDDGDTRGLHAGEDADE
jgi:hypothetical protein